MLANEPAQIRHITDDRERVRGNRWIGRCDIAQRCEPRSWGLEDLREPCRLRRRSDDERPEGEPSIGLQPLLIGLPHPTESQDEQQDEQPRQSDPCPGDRRLGPVARQDRKSTRLNSSHITISYAVFCLKKKKKIK